MDGNEKDRVQTLTATSTLDRIWDIRQRKILARLLEKDTTIDISDPLDSTMVLNMGPQHPATHGVLRVLLQIDGETVVKCVPELGYLHRGYEKLAEHCTPYEYITHTDRLDYIAPMSNNVAIVLAFEKLGGIEAPERAQWIRMLVAELARISSHLMAMGATCMDVGAMSVFLWAFGEREKLYDIFQQICGARFTTSYTRIGGVANDIDDHVLDQIRKWANEFPKNLKTFGKVVHRNRIFLDRMVGVGYIPRERAIQLGLTGPTLRGSGVEYDIRKMFPYLFYDQVDFDVITYDEGDCWARYMVRIDEMYESIRIIHQILEKMPRGPVMAQHPRLVLPRKGEIYTRMEELIMDFMLVNFGFRAEPGEIYSAIESPKGELGFYIVSDGSGEPWRLKIRSPSAANLQALAPMAEGSMIADVVAIIGSIDPIMGEADK